jgi:hypothetical protein
VTDCDPAYDHNSYFVGTAMSSFVTYFDNDDLTLDDIRLEALEEAVSSTIENDKYYQESLGIYTPLVPHRQHAQAVLRNRRRPAGGVIA